MTGAVMNWADTAELYWKFVGDGWSADSDDVEMEVYFRKCRCRDGGRQGR